GRELPAVGGRLTIASLCWQRGEMQPFSSMPGAPPERPHTPSPPTSTVEARDRRPMPPSHQGLQAARWCIWGLLAYFVIAVTIGLAWDGTWHATHTFDPFFSPPHVFVYTSLAITGLARAGAYGHCALLCLTHSSS